MAMLTQSVRVTMGSSMRVVQPPQRGMVAGIVRAVSTRCTSSTFRPRPSTGLSGVSRRRASRAPTTSAAVSEESPPSASEAPMDRPRHMVRAEERQKQQVTYLVAACAATLGISATAVAATVYRFSIHTADGASFPFMELFLSLLFTVGAAVGMEMYARYAHKGLWHETWMWELPEEWRAEWNKSVWYLHKSHHEPREGAFEQNDIFAVANALPAIALILYGFLHEGVVPGLAYGAGLGITIFGMAYMFVHDGLVHRRFPVGPIANVPYLKKIAMAHKLHHSEKFAGVPYGLFFAIEELGQCEGGLEELDQMLLAAELREVAAKQLQN
jgi:beta-carotene 3-hydroxylase